MHPQTSGLVCQGTLKGSTGGSTSTPRGLPLQKGADGTVAARMKTRDQICQDTVTSRMEAGSLAEGMHSNPSQSGPPQGPQENVSKQEEVPLEQREAQGVTREDD